jgi:hypothetical protein
MALLTSLRTDIRLNASAVPDVLIDRVLWRAARDFLTRTELWTSELSASMAYTAAAVSYDPTSLIPANTELVRIQSIRWLPDPYTLLFRTKEQLTANTPDWETAINTVPYLWTMMVPNVARLYPIASATVAAALSMTVSLTIPDAYTQIPDTIYRRHRDDILNGAQAILFQMPKKEWTDPRFAGNCGMLYEAAVAKAIAEASASFGRPTYQTAYGGI